MPSERFQAQLIEDAKLVIHFTNNWVFFGCYGFAVFFSLVAAVEGLFAG